MWQALQGLAPLALIALGVFILAVRSAIREIRESLSNTGDGHRD